MKKKTYCYENRTFEVIISNEFRGWLVEIWVEEVIRPDRKFFGRTKFFTKRTLDLDNYSSIDEAVKFVIAEGLNIETINDNRAKKWEEWDKETD